MALIPRQQVTRFSACLQRLTQDYPFSGPPAMKLITLVQVSDAEEGEEAIIAKLLTVRSHTISCEWRRPLQPCERADEAVF